MSARYIISAAAIILFATALLYAVDHKSFVPAMPQSTLVQAR
jgi:hypothetical protein